MKRFTVRKGNVKGYTRQGYLCRMSPAYFVVDTKWKEAALKHSCIYDPTACKEQYYYLENYEIKYQGAEYAKQQMQYIADWLNKHYADDMTSIIKHKIPMINHGGYAFLAED